MLRLIISLFLGSAAVLWAQPARSLDLLATPSAREVEARTRGAVPPEDVYWHELARDEASLNRALASLRGFRGYFAAQVAVGQRPGSESFFRAHGVLYSLHRVQAAGRLPAELRTAYEPIARALVGLHERGTNNRPTLWAAAAASATRVFPDASEAAAWRAYAEAVWQDWLLFRDTNEFGYWHHHLGGLLDLADALGRTSELRTAGFASVAQRYRDFVTPSGRAVTAGDGALMHGAMAIVFARCARVFDDPTLVWAAQRTVDAAIAEGRRDLAPLATLLGRSDATSAAQAPAFAPQVIHRYTRTAARAPDVLLLRRREPSGPFATFNVSDQENLMQHGHPRQKGELLHYEVEGATLLRHLAYAVRDEGGGNNVVLAEPGGEFPMRLATPVTPGVRYRGSISLPRTTYARPAEDFKLIAADSPEGVKHLLGRGDAPGYFLYNPRNYFGAGRQFRFRSLELRFLVTQPGQPMSAWVGREFQMINADPAPGAAPVTVRLSRLRLVGPRGEHAVHPLDRVDDTVALAHIPPTEPARHHSHTPVVEPRHHLSDAAQTRRLRTVPASTPAAGGLEVECHPGSTVLTLRGFDVPVDAWNDYTRLEFDYVVEGDTRHWRIVPIVAQLDGETEVARVDREPGGILVGAITSDHDGDSFGEFAFRDFYTADTRLTRRTLLTREGILLVRDDIDVGASAHGMLGGPVWQLPANPRRGLNWFSAPAAWPENTGARPHVLVYFEGPQGAGPGLRRYGVQHLPFGAPYPHGLGGGRVRAGDSYAVHAHAPLRAGRVERFLTVLMPLRNETAVADFARAIVATTDDEGRSQVTVAGVKIQLDSTGAWTVSRP